MLLVGVVLAGCQRYNATMEDGHFCNPGAPRLYDLADRTPSDFYVYSVEGSRWNEMSTEPACDCRNNPIRWSAETLPARFSFVTEFDVEDQCEVTSLGFAWEIAPVRLPHTQKTPAA